MEPGETKPPETGPEGTPSPADRRNTRIARLVLLGFGVLILLYLVPLLISQLLVASKH